jgi:hypothetical protein
VVLQTYSLGQKSLKNRFFDLFFLFQSFVKKCILVKYSESYLESRAIFRI